MDMLSGKLNPEQVQIIQKDVAQAGITYSHLEDDLVDHICCYIEELLGEGDSFEEAQVKARKTFGYTHLKEIEIKTILVINQKFKTMKTFLKISGITGFLLFLIGLVMKFAHWPGASIIFTFAFLILLGAYLPVFALAVRKEKILGKNRFLLYTGIVAVFFAMITFVFSMMHWPYKEYLIAGSWLSLLLFIILFFLHSMKTKEYRMVNLSLILVFSIYLLGDIYGYAVIQMSPVNVDMVVEPNLENEKEYFSAKSFQLEEDIIDSADSVSVPVWVRQLINRSDTLVDHASTIKAMLFRERSEAYRHNTRFFRGLKKTDAVYQELINFSHELQNYQQWTSSLTDSEDLPVWSAHIISSLSFGFYEMNSSPVMLYNNLTRVIRDIRIVETELLGAIRQ